MKVQVTVMVPPGFSVLFVMAENERGERMPIVPIRTTAADDVEPLEDRVMKLELDVQSLIRRQMGG